MVRSKTNYGPRQAMWCVINTTRRKHNKDLKAYETRDEAEAKMKNASADCDVVEAIREGNGFRGRTTACTTPELKAEWQELAGVAS